MRTLRSRLIIAYAGLILLGFAIVALLAGRQILAGTLQDFSQGIAEQAQLVAKVLKEPIEEEAEHAVDQAALSSILQSYAEQIGASLLLFDREGNILASSDDGSDTNLAVVHLALDGAASSDLRNDLIYAAAPIFEESKVIGAVQVSAPISAAKELIWERWLALGGTVIAVTAMAALAAVWLSTTLTKPLAQMREATIKIAQGDFSERLPETRQDELGEVARSFNQMTAQVEAMIDEQRAFASNASHELRTPLTAIRLRSEALREGGLDPSTAQQYVVEIDEEVRQMGNLVQDLMLLSRLDSGRLEAGLEQVDTGRLARQLVSEIAPQADRQSVIVELDIANALPPVMADSSHLMIVFRNLLTNALKYTPEGGHITWRIEADAETIYHTIIDTGQGIAAEDLPYVFDRFYRVDKSRSREVQGVGLGLSLVRMIVEFYGGTVRLSSEGIGEGTISYVAWPCNVPLAFSE
ncbi:MAG: sensor histidine kinase [Candidatus Promineifilaceae bacterium]